MNMSNTKNIKLNIASLNANSIIKTNNKKLQSNYNQITFAIYAVVHFLCLQKSHADSDNKINHLDMQF